MTGNYHIYVRGRLGPEMLHLLADLDPVSRPNTTVLHTTTTDQAELHGALTRLRDLALNIESVRQTTSDVTDG